MRCGVGSISADDLAEEEMVVVASERIRAVLVADQGQRLDAFKRLGCRRHDDEDVILGLGRKTANTRSASIARANGHRRGQRLPCDRDEAALDRCLP